MIATHVLFQMPHRVACQHLQDMPSQVRCSERMLQLFPTSKYALAQVLEVRSTSSHQKKSHLEMNRYLLGFEIEKREDHIAY